MNIVITGASSGIGRELALNFAKDPDTKILAISRTTEKLISLSVASENKNIRYMAGDITKLVKLPEKLLNDVKSHISEIDILINNVGLLISESFTASSQANDLRVIDTNFLAPMQLTKILFPMISPLGHVVNISSMSGYQGSSKYPGLAVYGAAKAALSSLTESLAKEFEKSGPSFNSLSLGAVQTEMLNTAFPGYKAPLQPWEMAEFICWFALNGSKFFNGKNLPVAVVNP